MSEVAVTEAIFDSNPKLHQGSTAGLTPSGMGVPWNCFAFPIDLYWSISPYLNTFSGITFTLFK